MTKLNLTDLKLQLKDAESRKIDSPSLTTDCPKCNGSGYVWLSVDGYDQAKLCECQYREVKDSLLKASGFPMEVFPRMTFDTFVTKTDEQKKMKALAQRFVDEGGHWMGFFGKSGTGKTHICIAACQELVNRYKIPFKYVSYRPMMRTLRSYTFNNEKYSELLADLVEADVLYIDDFLKLSIDSKGEVMPDELRIVYDIINERYLREKITVFSSEYSMKDIATIDEALGSRIVDFIGEYGFRCEGNNYRFGG